jgi:hypothetical protein
MVPDLCFHTCMVMPNSGSNCTSTIYAEIQLWFSWYLYGSTRCVKGASVNTTLAVGIAVREIMRLGVELMVIASDGENATVAACSV